MICRIKILDIISQARYITKGDAIHLLLNRHQDKKMGLFETHFRFQAQLIEQKDCQYCLFIVLTGIAQFEARVGIWPNRYRLTFSVMPGNIATIVHNHILTIGAKNRKHLSH